jgi:hypothetical protein
MNVAVSFVQMGHLDVVVPPDFINEETSGDLMVPEGGTVKLTCRARGYPVPDILWRREDNAELIIKEPSGVKTRGQFCACFSSHLSDDHSTFLDIPV